VRWSPLSGIAFVACFAVAVVLFGSGAGSQPAEIASYYASSGDRARQIAGFYVLAAGVLFFVWFASVLSRALAAPVVLATGAVTAALLLASDALWGATAVTVQHEHAFRLDPSTHLLVEDAGFVLFVAAMLVALGFVVAASVAALRTGALPRVLAIVGFPVAVSLAVSWYFLPVFALLAWVAAASVFLIRGTQSP
jgi:hypothetical protein